MKAQLSVEYYISLIIFIGFIVYISFQVMRISPQFITEVKNERLKSEAYQISELLINDAGEPINWAKCELLLYYDADSNGFISMSEALKAIADCNSGLITEYQRDVVLSVWGAGSSIDSICPSGYKIKRVGLSNNENKTNLLSQEKIDAFNTSCSSDYDNIRKLMGIGTEYYFSLKLVDSNSGQTLIDCNPPLTVIKPAKVAITRITALSPTTFGELVIQLW